MLLICGVILLYISTVPCSYSCNVDTVSFGSSLSFLQADLLKLIVTPVCKKRSLFSQITTNMS